jgi:hypothetical protein
MLKDLTYVSITPQEKEISISPAIGEKKIWGKQLMILPKLMRTKRLILGVKSYMDKKDINVKEIC